MSFNIFSILEKDNKELIHSSFIKFLLQNDNEFSSKFLNIQDLNCDIVSLEKSYSLSKRPRKKCRFDLEIINEDRIVVIENKFKSFPNVPQLQDYDKIINNEYPKHLKSKFLFCFDKNLFIGYTDWIIKDYRDLLDYLEKYIFTVIDSEIKNFINHYISFLRDYIITYNELGKDLKPIMYNQSDNTNKFWIRLLYSNLKIKLDNHFIKKGLDVETFLSVGTTSIPLINITPKHWITNKVALLIQLQNGDLKFYAHTNDKFFLNELIEFSKTAMNSTHNILSFKKIGLRKENTSYIFKLNINKHISEKEEFTIDTLLESIILYYEKIDSKVIKQYNFTEAAIV